MSTNGSLRTAATVEIDMRDLLRAKKDGASDVAREPNSDFASLIFQISGQSVHEIDHLIAGLQGVRDKLNTDRDRIRREVQQHASFSQSIVDLTGIINDAMASVNKHPVRVAPENV
jgi:ABC-type transporter Mla subunit MlaD